jgi:hypothetical protein
MSLRARVDAVRDVPPLSTAGADALRELDRALDEATEFEDLPGKWQAAILEAETSSGEPPHEA